MHARLATAACTCFFLHHSVTDHPAPVGPSMQSHMLVLEAELQAARSQLAAQLHLQQHQTGAAASTEQPGSPSDRLMHSMHSIDKHLPSVASPSAGARETKLTSPDWQSPAHSSSAFHQKNGKENKAGNSVSSAAEKPSGKREAWEHERSELLSLLERLQEQLSAHAEQAEAGEEELKPCPSARSTPYAPPSDGEEGPPPAAAYDSPKAPRPQQHEGASPNTRRPAANLDTFFAEAAAADSSDGFEADVSSPNGCAPNAPPLAAHHLHDTPASPRPSSLGGAPSPPGTQQCTTKTPPSQLRSKTSNAGMHPSPFASPATESRLPGTSMQEADLPQPATAAPVPSSLESEQQRRRAEAYKASGNVAFQRREHDRAAHEYTRGLEALSSLGGHDSSVLAEPQDARLAAVLFCNRAAALQASGRHVDAISDCFRAEATDASYLRTFQRRADAYIALGAFGPALAVRTLCCALRHVALMPVAVVCWCIVSSVCCLLPLSILTLCQCSLIILAGPAARCGAWWRARGGCAPARGGMCCCNAAATQPLRSSWPALWCHTSRGAVSLPQAGPAVSPRQEWQKQRAASCSSRADLQAGH